jgi:MFS family permease
VGYNVAATLLSVPGGRLSDSRGPVVVLGAGIGCLAASYAAFALVGPELVVLAVAFAGAGIAIGLIETAQHAAVATFAPAGLRGSAFGFLAALQSFGNLAASAVAGLIWTAVSPRAAFLYLAAWMVVALALLPRGLPAAGLSRPR